MKVSLGLLPSGPDPVGEEHVRANLPKGYMRGKKGGCKASGGEELLKNPQDVGERRIVDNSKIFYQVRLIDRPELFGQNQTPPILKADRDAKSSRATARR